MHYALRDSWASPVAQLVKNLRAMQQQCMVTEVFFFFFNIYVFAAQDVVAACGIPFHT